MGAALNSLCTWVGRGVIKKEETGKKTGSDVYAGREAEGG